MNQNKKIHLKFLNILTLLIFTLLLSACEKEGVAMDVKKVEILEKILKDARERTRINYYNLIAEGNFQGVQYYEVWSGVCYPPFPIFYNNNGEFVCSNNYFMEEELDCVDQLELERREVIYSVGDNCYDAAPINKYQIKPEE